MKTKDAIQYFGSKKAVADALNITKGALTFWGEDVPDGRAAQLELITKGKLKATLPKMKQAS